MLLPLMSILLAVIVDEDEESTFRRFMKRLASSRKEDWGFPIVFYEDGTRIERILTFDQLCEARNDLKVANVQIEPSKWPRDEDEFLVELESYPWFSVRDGLGKVKAVFRPYDFTDSLVSEPIDGIYADLVLVDLIDPLEAFEEKGRHSAEAKSQKGSWTGFDEGWICGLFSASEHLIVDDKILPTIDLLRRLDDAYRRFFRLWRYEDRDEKSKEISELWKRFHAEREKYLPILQDEDHPKRSYFKTFDKHMDSVVEEFSKILDLQERNFWQMKLSDLTSEDPEDYKDDPDYLAWRQAYEAADPDSTEMSPAKESSNDFENLSFDEPIDLMKKADDGLAFILSPALETRSGSTRRSEKLTISQSGFSSELYEIDQRSSDSTDIDLYVKPLEERGNAISRTGILVGFRELGVLTSFEEIAATVRKRFREVLRFPTPETLTRLSMLQHQGRAYTLLNAPSKLLLEALAAEDLLRPEERAVLELLASE